MEQNKIITTDLINAEEILNEVFREADEIEAALIEMNGWVTKELRSQSKILNELNCNVKSLHTSLNHINEKLLNLFVFEDYKS